MCVSDDDLGIQEQIKTILKNTYTLNMLENGVFCLLGIAEAEAVGDIGRRETEVVAD
jgi:hypothetical protein